MAREDPQQAHPEIFRKRLPTWQGPVHLHQRHLLGSDGVAALASYQCLCIGSINADNKFTPALAWQRAHRDLSGEHQGLWIGKSADDDPAPSGVVAWRGNR